MQVPARELTSRLARFRAEMDLRSPGWSLAAITERINLYYFTGTIQDGLLLIPRGGDAVFWVRKSFERAQCESLFPDIRPMKSYRDAAAATRPVQGPAYLELDSVTLAQYGRMQKHFAFSAPPLALDAQVAAVRAVKSQYELSLMEKAGKIHRHVFEDCIPDLLVEGMDEIEFGTRLYSLMMQEGHQGIVRFRMFNEMLLGQVGFGVSTITPTCVDTPGGISGLHPAIPLMGNREKKLNKGDLVVVDTGCGVEGYHTDKTMNYMFGKAIPDAAIKVHEKCVAVQDEVASMLKPGAVPSEIYATVVAGLSPEFKDGFMGFGQNTVKFLGHGIGLEIDESPVIAPGFDEPLQEGMVFAIEPKKGIAGLGLVGIENTFVVTPQGGRSLTGNNRGLIPVGFLTG
ncbi:peptidase M24 [Methanoregula boonei 6A8]|uniref:Peptidase M24 n=1 Tax=Methanoregula boonei (strain DSM 21154 / JCM 14090 / 6A8) TaxID=456442 RepID=A7I4M4_METB6|nr:Xaa-Pro peptidase family protein [Methanoregula boonei]ABS54685.1 peptidase M24 [Methanoregula boonei 6A8]